MRHAFFDQVRDGLEAELGATDRDLHTCRSFQPRRTQSGLLDWQVP